MPAKIGYDPASPTLTGRSEEDLTESLEVAMEKYPDTYAVLVRRHGM
jgi:hypothetical protein